VSTQVLTYPQNSAADNILLSGYPAPYRELKEWWQVIDSVVFFGDASNLSDEASGTANQVFGDASASFPTKLSTETVGDFKNAYGS
jgi:hypothetical protein